MSRAGLLLASSKRLVVKIGSSILVSVAQGLGADWRGLWVISGMAALAFAGVVL